MPLHPDFQRLLDDMIEQYGEEKGERIFWALIKKCKYDETKPMKGQRCQAEESLIPSLTTIKQSFSWLLPPDVYRAAYGDGNYYLLETVHTGVMKNLLNYSREELIQAARSLAFRPINVNHEKWLPYWDNMVVDANFEGDAVEVLIKITDPDVIHMIETGEITSASIEADMVVGEWINGFAAHRVRFHGLALVTRDRAPADPKTVGTIRVFQLQSSKPSASGGAVQKMRNKETVRQQREEGERERLRREAEERAQRYGIGVKEGGHLTKPKEYASIPDDQFADPVNYRYPIDAEHIRAALSYFNMPKNRETGGYTHEEQVRIMEKIIRAALKYGIEVQWKPDDPVYHDLPEDLKEKLVGYEQISQTEKPPGVKELLTKVDQILGQLDDFSKRITTLERAVEEIKRPIQVKTVTQASGQSVVPSEASQSPPSIKMLVEEIMARSTW